MKSRAAVLLSIDVILAVSSIALAKSQTSFPGARSVTSGPKPRPPNLRSPARAMKPLKATFPPLK